MKQIFCVILLIVANATFATCKELDQPSTADSQATSIGILAKTLACGKTPCKKLSTANKVQADEDEEYDNYHDQLKIETTIDDGASVVPTADPTPLPCDVDAKANCFDGCYPPGSIERKHMMYCSYCCLECKCDAEMNPSKLKDWVPIEVRSYGAAKQWTTFKRRRRLRR